jgi:hypothetical protein
MSFMKKRNYFLTVLKAEKSKLQALTSCTLEHGGKHHMVLG